jgi:hypothetical protein
MPSSAPAVKVWTFGVVFGSGAFADAFGLGRAAEQPQARDAVSCVNGQVRSDPPEPLSADRLAGPGKFIAFDATKIEHSPSSACPPVSWRLVLSTEHRTGT